MQGQFSMIVVLLLTLGGCVSIGPGTVARDRFDYISAISDSWKSQMLLNLVKLRTMRIAPITRDALIRLVVATLAPVVPLALTMMPLEELLRKLLGILF